MPICTSVAIFAFALVMVSPNGPPVLVKNDVPLSGCQEDAEKMNRWIYAMGRDGEPQAVLACLPYYIQEDGCHERQVSQMREPPPCTLTMPCGP